MALISPINGLPSSLAWSTELMGVSDDPCADGAFGDGKMNDGYTLED